jgi:hypothetical protein
VVATPDEQQKAPYGARIAAWSLTAAWAGLIFAASSVPRGSSIPMPGAGWDKVAHASVFAVLGGLATLALRAGGRSRRRAAVLATLLAIIYGMLDEVHQAWTPGRAMDADDVLADSVGAGAGAAAVGLTGLADLALARWPRPVEERV